MLLPIFAIVGIFFISLLFLYRVWHSHHRKPSANSFQSSPEWVALLAQREGFESDATLSEEAKQELRSAWSHTAAKLSSTLQSAENGVSAVSKKQRFSIVLATFFVAGIVFALIAERREGAWDIPNSSQHQMVSSNEPMPEEGAKHPGDMGNLEERIQSLQQKLKENPKDIEKWVLLSRSLAVQRDFPAAADALRHAVDLSPDHPDLLADLADIVAMVNGRSLLGEPITLIDKALKSDPTHPKALALAATAAMQQGDKSKSLALWTKLRETYQGKPDELAKIDEIIAQIKTQDLNQLMAKSGMSNAEKPTAAVSKPEAVPQTRVAGQVTLPLALAKKVSALVTSQSVLYVFAKLEAGPPMPLAVLKLDPKYLLNGKPVAFELNESMAMSPQLSLATASVVKVEARLALSGNAMKQDGDLSVVATGVKVGAQNVQLTFAE